MYSILAKGLDSMDQEQWSQINWMLNLQFRAFECISK